MFIRKNRNRSGSVSIQIVQKVNRTNNVIKIVGVARTKREEELLILLARTEIERLQGMQSLFIEHDDLVVDNFVNGIANDHLQIIGSELILGRIYDKIGFPTDGACNYFRNLVLCRLVYPGSKLKMAVTTKPSKLKAGSKDANRRKSFCARMGGMPGAMKKPNGEPTRKALALKKWNC